MYNPSFIFFQFLELNEIRNIRRSWYFQKITYVHTFWFQCRYRLVTFENPAHRATSPSVQDRSIRSIRVARGNATSNFHEIYLHGTPIVRCATGEPRFHSLTREYDTYIYTHTHMYIHIYNERKRKRERG